MRRIIKPGKDLNKKERLIYTTTCPVCGCVFEFEDEDCLTIERCLNGRVTIACPHCNAEFKVRRSECESRKKSISEQEQKYNDLYVAHHVDPCENPCVGCPHKDGPKDGLGNPVPGDSMCQFCPHYKWKLTC